MISKKVVVLANDSNGEPSFASYEIKGSQDFFDNGDHYDKAKQMAEGDGYEAIHAFDENDHAYRQMKAGSITGIDVVLNTFDDGGNVVDTTTVNLTQEAVSDIIDQASNFILAKRDNNESDKEAAEAELEEALSSRDII